MIAKKSQLRAITRRRMVIDGPHALSPDGDCVVFKEFTIIGPDGKICRRVEAGERVLLATRASVKMLDNIALIHVNPELYVIGTVNGPTVLAPEDGARPVVLSFTPVKRVDAADISYLLDLRVCE